MIDSSTLWGLFLSGIPGVVSLIGLFFMFYKLGWSSGSQDKRIEALETLVKIQSEAIVGVKNDMASHEKVVQKLEVAVGQLGVLVGEYKKYNGGKS